MMSKKEAEQLRASFKINVQRRREREEEARRKQAEESYDKAINYIEDKIKEFCDNAIYRWYWDIKPFTCFFGHGFEKYRNNFIKHFSDLGFDNPHFSSEYFYINTDNYFKK